MRVLYVLANYPQASESYIEAEIKYVRSCGVEVEVWSQVNGYGEAASVPVHRDSLKSVVEQVRPDLVHIHYLITALDFLLFVSGLPATVRAHSFDWQHSMVRKVAEFPQVRAIYAFPHFAREGIHEKVVPLPVAFDGSLYNDFPPTPHERAVVIRFAAGRRAKGLHDFMEVSGKLRSKAEFHLAVSRVRGDEKYLLDLEREGKSFGVNVHVDLSRPQTVHLMKTAGIYLDTSDPSAHPFGMPISIAEAMASGLIVLVRDCPAAQEYLGEAGAVYSSVQEAAQYIEIALALPESSERNVRNLSIQRAKSFRSDVVLPRLIEDWKRFTS